MLRKSFITLFISIVSLNFCLSQKIILEKASGKKKSIEINSGDIISIEYLDKTQQPFNPVLYKNFTNKNLSFFQGKVLSISDTSIILKPILKKSKFEIPISKVAKIQKDNLFLDLSIGLLTMGGIILIPELIALNPLPYQVTGLILFPSLNSFLDHNLLNKMKIVNQEFWKNKNKWRLTVH